MIVLGIAVIMFVDRAAAQIHLAQQSRFHEFRQRTIDGGPAHASRSVLPGDFGDQLVGVEMFVPAEDMVHQRLPLLSISLAATLQKLLKSLLGCERRLDSAKGEFVRGHAVGDAELSEVK